MSTLGKSRWIMMAILGIVGGLVLSGLGSLDRVHAEESPMSPSQYAPPAMGQPDAPITIIEFGDFQ